ncbi:hypothetical protein ACU6QD_07625 [Corynebacterium glucuronolyticum]
MLDSFRKMCEKTTIPVILAAGFPIAILVEQNQGFLDEGGTFVAVAWAVLLAVVVWMLYLQNDTRAVFVSKLIFLACMVGLGLTADMWAWILMVLIGLVAMYSDAKRRRNVRA